MKKQREGAGRRQTCSILKPEEIELDGSDGPYGDNVIDQDDEAAERVRVSFHACQRHHSSASRS
jgi:hypothetical protein